MSNSRAFASCSLVVFLAFLAAPGLFAQIFSNNPYDASKGYDASHGLRGRPYDVVPNWSIPAPEPAPVKGPPAISADFLRHPLSRRGLRFLANMEKLAERGQHQQAIRELQAGMPQYPADAVYFYNLIGVESVQIGDFRAAKDAFARVLAEMPHVSANHLNYGLSLIPLGEVDLAEKHLRTALVLDDTSRGARVTLEELREARRKNAAAAKPAPVATAAEAAKSDSVETNPSKPAATLSY